MKIKKILLPIVGVAAIAAPLFSLTSCNVAVKEIKITPSTKATYVAETPRTVKFTAEVLPANAKNKGVKWSITSGSEFAEIDETTGVLTALKEGEVTVKATAADGSGVTQTSTIKIYPQAVEYLSAYADNEAIKTNTPTQLNTYVYPETSCKDVKWEVSNSDVAEINTEGKITMKKSGSVQVICSSVDGSEQTATFTVIGYDTAATKVEFNASTPSTIDIGQQVKLSASVDSNATLKGISWSIEDTAGKASIDPNGYITGAAAGKVKVTATSEDGIAKAEKEITVNNNEYAGIDHEEYIQNRSISIQAIGTNAEGTVVPSHFGTGWIIADATPTITDDYRYYVAIPRTLQNEFDKIEAECKKNNFSFGYRVSTKMSNDPIKEWADYVSVTEYYPIPVAKTSYLGGEFPEFTVGKTKYTKGADLQVVYMDFSRLITEKTAPKSEHTLRRLSKLNALQKAGEPIVKLARLNDDGTVSKQGDIGGTKYNLKDLKLYTGGYPKEWTNSHITWECDDVTVEAETQANAETIQLQAPKLNVDKVKATKAIEAMAGQYHLFNNMVDVAPYFISKEVNGMQVLQQTGGAGSMLIIDFDANGAHEFQILGMYWGTSNVRQKTTDPHFTVLNSYQKFYLEDYVTSK